MEKDKDAYYIVQKGGLVGFYKSLKEYEAEAGYSVFDGNAKVYKGYNLSEEAKQYLMSRGLQKATYTISAANLTNDLFGKLLACPYDYEEPSASRGKMPEEYTEVKRPLQVPSVFRGRMAEEYSEVNRPLQVLYTDRVSYTLEFDGASKGNPGLAGAGAVLRSEDGSRVCRLQEGVGIATNNVAEYRAVILGLRHALKNGVKQIRVQGDSKLVCMQIQDRWKTKNQNMASLCKVAKELKDKFLSFEISHIPRELNSEADDLANRGVSLRDGEVFEDCSHR